MKNNQIALRKSTDWAYPNPKNTSPKSEQPEVCSPSGKLFIHIPPISSILWPYPSWWACPAIHFDSTAEIKCTHTVAIIQLIFSLGFLCSVPGSFVRPSLTPNCCTCVTMEIAPSSLPPSSQAQSPNHLVPRHKSFPLQARKPRIPPSTGKEIFKCNQRIFLCFIYFFPGEIHLSEVFDVFFCSSVRPHRCTEAEWSQPAKLNIFSLFGVDTDDTCLVPASVSNCDPCFI